MEANYFTILWWFLPYIDMNQQWVYMCSPSWPSLPPPSSSHPSGLSQCTIFECPVSCIKPGLAIYFTYDNIHVSMLFSQIIPPLHSPTESKSLFFASVSLLMSHRHLRDIDMPCCLMVIITIFLNSIYMVNILYWLFSFWLISLCIIGSSFIHLIRTDSNASFLMAE